MNQGGWGLKDIFIYVGVITLALLVAMILYNKNFKQLFDSASSIETYTDLESKLIRAARTYTDNFYYKALEDGDAGYVSVKTLKDSGVIDKIEDINDSKIECSGYVHFNKEESTVTYDPYLKCDNNYITTGYDSYYDE